MLMGAHRTRRWAQAGMSLVELLVGVALGLFIVGGATLAVGTQLGANRRLLLETQVQQDLRAAADIVTRDLRRSGYWVNANLQSWSPTNTIPSKNPLTDVTVSGASVEYAYDRAGNQQGPFKFRLNSGVLQVWIGGGWQALTDARTMVVTAFTITESNVSSSVIACPKVCTDGTSGCWPKVATRDYEIVLTGQAATDATVSRTLRSSVSLRNDLIEYRNTDAPAAACPP